ncbi:hypothetical protein GCM10010504_46610 [Streptomyces griseus]|nr:hypothetical protein GCM10010504_46610 [Streptomyces griseus]
MCREVTGGTGVACAKMTGGTGKPSGVRTENRARNVAQSTLLRLMRKEIRVTAGGPGCGPWIPTHGPHPAYPRRVRSRTVAHRRRTHKAPHGLHVLIRWAPDAYPTSYSLFGEAERGDTFHFWPKPRGDLL